AVSLAGLECAWAGYSPGPLHEGNLTSVWIIDEATSEEQRSAIEALAKGNGVGLPFDIFASITATRLDTIIAPFAVVLDGMNSTAKIDGGRIYDLAMPRL